MAKRKLRSKKHIKKDKRSLRKKGKAPGAVIYVGEREGMEATVNILEYNDTKLDAKTLEAGEIPNLVVNDHSTWIDVIGLSDEKFMEALGKNFKLNPLVVEDAINTHQRPKVDEYEDYIFAVLKMLYLDEKQNLVSEHVAFLLFPSNVVVLQEVKEDVFDGVRNRIRNQYGRIRNRGADYLFFALIDAVVDHYFEALEYIFDKIETLEDEVHYKPTQETAREIQELKKEVLRLHKYIFPVRELVSRLIDTEHPLVTKDTKLFLRDALDHCIEINETLQIYREMAISLMEMYMSSVSNKMNEVMKVLTIMASIFIPLTFIAGIYGMNFERMPELSWRYGYAAALGLMFLILVAMLIFFKKKNWL